MKLNKPENENYSALIVRIGEIYKLEGLNNLNGTMVLGNQVIINSDIQKGDIVIYLPLESSLSSEYLQQNNLHKDMKLNKNEISGYFESDGRVRCIKLKGNKSEGFIMPLSSLDYINTSIKNNLSVGDVFDKIDNHEICHKYDEVASIRTYENSNPNPNILKGHFNFHPDTPLLYRYIDKIKPDDFVSITRKMHGISGISGKLLHYEFKWYDKIIKLFFKNHLPKTCYKEICSSRKVIRDIKGNSIWALAHSKIKDSILDGVTLYYEIVGFTPEGKYIQNRYDYGCQPKNFEIYVYRITYSVAKGFYEIPFELVKIYCGLNNLKHVQELYNGKAKDLINENGDFNNLLEELKTKFLNSKDKMCKNNVPIEGIVIRKKVDNFEAYKLKSSEFLQYETKELDKKESMSFFD